MSVYGDVITNQESEALAKIARLALANSRAASAPSYEILARALMYWGPLRCDLWPANVVNKSPS